jgi:hypothetical protein
VTSTHYATVGRTGVMRVKGLEQSDGTSYQALKISRAYHITLSLSLFLHLQHTHIMSKDEVITAYKTAIPGKQEQNLPGLDKHIDREFLAKRKPV